jgi:hypothetical protein
MVEHYTFVIAEGIGAWRSGFQLPEDVSQVILPEVESHCEVLEDLKYVFGNEGNPEHGRVADGKQHVFLEEAIEPLLVLNLLNFDLLVEYLVEILLSRGLPDLEFDHLLMIDILLLLKMHKLLLDLVILVFQLVPLPILLNPFDLLAVGLHPGCQQAFMETHMIVKSLHQIATRTMVLNLDGVEQQFEIACQVLLKWFFIDISAWLVVVEINFSE